MEKALQKAETFICRSCGAKLAFNPQDQLLKCPYCDNRIDVVKLHGDIHEYDFNLVAGKPADWGNAAAAIKCQSCGAEIILGNTSIAKICVFCGSSHVLKNNQFTGIAPESVIPFKITKKQAIDSFSSWIKKRWFSPGNLKTNYKTHSIYGVYVPCWTYDAMTDSTYTAEAGDYYYEKITRWVEENGQEKEVTESVRRTLWRSVGGSCQFNFDDIVVNASTIIDGDLFEKTGAFNLSELVQYRPEFLSGFLAQKYSIDLQEGWEKAKKVIDDDVEKRIKDNIAADEVRSLNINTRYYNIKYKHILLPQWISSYTYKNKVYHFIVNGQTGAVGGQAPISVPKVIGAALASASVIGLIIMLINW